jgi:CRP-like cAMP-binding protein
MLTVEQKRDLLAKSDLFHSLPPEALELVAKRSGERSLAAGERLFAEGDLGDALFFVVEGAVEIVKGEPDAPHVLAVLEPPDVFGEMAVLAEGVRTTAARARAPSTLLFLKAKAIRILIQNSPSVAFGLFKVLIRRLALANETIVSLREQGRVRARLTAVAGPDAGRTFAVVRRRVEIGRAGAGGAEDGARVGLSDPTNRIARSHAELSQAGESFFLRPLAAGAPTLINGEAAEGAVELQEGDEISLGPVVLRFSCAGTFPGRANTQ